MIENLKTWLLDTGVDPTWVDALMTSIGVVVIVLVAILFHFIAKQIILRTVVAVIRRSKTHWDDVLIEKKVLARVAHFAPAIVVNWLAPVFFGGMEEVLVAMKMGVNIYLILIFLWVIDSFLNAVLSLYHRTEKTRRIPLKGFLQAVKLVVNLIGLIIILSIAFGKSPIYFQ